MKIRFENVCFHYNTKLPQQQQVLKNINLEISDGEFIGLIGPSGSGKTTLFQHFTGLLRPSSGTVYVDEKDIWSKSYPLSALRKKIGLVFQFPEAQLFEETVYADVGFGPRAFHLSADEVDLRVKEVLKLVEMDGEAIKNRSPFQLSEGEKRRIAIAGVLAMAPKMLVLDEPTACLDPAGIKLITQILKQLYENGTTILLITHNIDVIIELVQRVIVLNKGQIFFDGSKEAICADSRLLKSVDLETPRIVRFCQYLLQKGILIQNNIFSVEQLKLVIKNCSLVNDE